MGRIGVTLSGIERSLLNRLAEANAEATLSSLRMASGNMIDSPADDPSAFTWLSSLQSQLSNVRAATTNVTAASSMVTQVQTSLDGIRTQLNTIRTELLSDETGSLTGAERADAQANIDAAITQINTLASTEIDGRRLLNGSANFDFTGRNALHVSDVRVYSTSGGTMTIAGSVDSAATQAQLTYTGNAGVNTIVSTATFTLTGDSGNIEITVTADDPLDTLITEVNENSHKTGITASRTNEVVTFSSVDHGSGSQASIAVSSGTFIVAAGETTSDTGTDATATINGHAYTGDGNQVTVNHGGAHYNIEFTPGYTGNFDTIAAGGDALSFVLSADVYRSATLSIPSLLSTQLGGVSGRLDQLAAGSALDDLGTNTSQAIRVVDEALADLTRIEGAVDGFYNSAVSSASSLLSDLESDLETAIDDVNLVNTTEETIRQSYYIGLASNAVAGLAVIQSQRASIVNLLRVMAGLT